MNIYDKIKEMDIQQLSKFIVECSERTCRDHCPWIDLLDERYCSKCQPIIDCYPESTIKIEFAPCDTPKGCPYGVSNLTEEQLVEQWLLSEWKEDK